MIIDEMLMKTLSNGSPQSRLISGTVTTTRNSTPSRSRVIVPSGFERPSIFSAIDGWRALAPISP